MTVGAASPIRVEITRGGEVESVHEVDAVIVDSAGTLVSAWGDPDRGVMPRSAIKPIQAISLVESGAADAFELSGPELAMSCSSHGGEPGHVDTVTPWLARLGFGAETLECGAHLPLYEPAAHAMVAAGVDPDRRHNNCSGKHSGFLTLCAHLGYDPAGYLAPEHPLHANHVTPTIAEFCEVDLSDQRPGVDGCGIPVWSVPMRAMAHGWAKLADHPAGRRLGEAMMAHPFHVAGTERACTDIMSKATRPTMAKGGAEGVYCALVVEEGLAVSVKARDGAHRASEAATRHLLARLGVLEEPTSPITNWAGTEVGEIRTVG